MKGSIKHPEPEAAAFIVSCRHGAEYRACSFHVAEALHLAFGRDGDNGRVTVYQAGSAAYHSRIIHSCDWDTRLATPTEGRWEQTPMPLFTTPPEPSEQPPFDWGGLVEEMLEGRR